LVLGGVFLLRLFHFEWATVPPTARRKFRLRVTVPLNYPIHFYFCFPYYSFFIVFFFICGEAAKRPLFFAANGGNV
jgi:hypothetical protein